MTIADAPHVIEIDWKASTALGANNGSLNWWIDETQQTAITSFDYSSRKIDRVRMGAGAGVDTSTNGTLCFDAFESRRSTYIGPIAPLTTTTTITYTYDPLYRLTRADYSDGRYFAYTYDAVGNDARCLDIDCACVS